MRVHLLSFVVAQSKNEVMHYVRFYGTCKELRIQLNVLLHKNNLVAASLLTGPCF